MESLFKRCSGLLARGNTGKNLEPTDSLKRWTSPLEPERRRRKQRSRNNSWRPAKSDGWPYSDGPVVPKPDRNASSYHGRETAYTHIAKQEGKEWVFFCPGQRHRNSSGTHKDKYFEIFNAFMETNTRVPAFGLAICKKIVERHGGPYGWSQRWGRGSTFYFTIPVREGCVK